MKRWHLLALLGALAVGCGGSLPDEPARELPVDEVLSPGSDGVSAQWNTPRPRLGPAYLVKDIFPPSEQDPTGEAEAPGPENLVDVGGTLFFSTTFRTAGEVLLWKSDGTAPGTIPLLRLPTVVRPESSPFVTFGDMTAVGRRLFFTAFEEAHGQELWTSDGTVAGTRRLELTPGPDSTLLGSLVAVRDTLFFFRGRPSGTGTPSIELWKSDGTAEGTVRVRELGPGAVLFPTASDHALFFSFGDAEHGQELWVSNGTASGTRQVTDINPGPAGSFPSELLSEDGEVYFFATEPKHGRELWKSDGTRGGTRLVADIIPGTAGSSARPFAVLDQRLYFTVWDEARRALLLWKVRVDGDCRHRPVLLAELPTPSNAEPEQLLPQVETSTTTGGKVFFIVQYFGFEGFPIEAQLWVTNGTRGGTRQVAGALLSGLFGFANPAPTDDGRVVFSNRDAEHGLELWESDGTSRGTRLLQDILPGPGSSVPRELTRSGGFIFFFAFTPEVGNELWALPLPRGAGRSAER